MARLDWLRLGLARCSMGQRMGDDLGWIIGAIVLGVACWVLTQRRRARRSDAIQDVPITDQAPRRPTFSRTPRRGSERHKVAPKASESQSQRARILDLHLRGAIFAVTDRDSIDGYDLVPLGLVRVDAGPMAETRLARAAGQKFPKANALVNLRAERSVKGKPQNKTKNMQEWRAEAVIATPRDPAMIAPIYHHKAVLIDGSNVINWSVDANLTQKPSLAPLKTVLLMLQARGQRAVVVFDATIGQRLNDRFMGHQELAAVLPSAAEIVVVEKGTIADTVLIEMARKEALVIITNDHFRDHPLARHLLKQKGYATPQGVTLLDPRA